MKKEALEDHLGAVLDRSWVDFGSSWVPPQGQIRAVAAVALVFLKIYIFEATRFPPNRRKANRQFHLPTAPYFLATHFLQSLRPFISGFSTNCPFVEITKVNLSRRVFVFKKIQILSV